MSQTTTYKCDRCKEEGTDQTTMDLKWVAVGVKQEHYSSYFGRTSDLLDRQNRGMEMCKKCRQELGIDDPPKAASQQPPAYPTLEELIREIVRTEISQG